MKTRSLRKILSISLSLLLIFSLLPVSALAAVYGDELKSDGRELAEGTVLSSSVSLGQRGYIRDNYIVYTANESVKPAVVYGSKVCNYGSFSSMAKLLEAKGLHVIGGINGDYYEMASYAPLGIVISEGVLRSSDAGHYAIGFHADGSAIIGQPTLSMSFVSQGEKYPIAMLNKVRSGSGFALFTDEFSYTTKNRSAGTDIILSISEETVLTVNCSFKATVEEIKHSNGAIELPEGRLVLSISDESDPWRLGMLENLEVGQTIDFSISCEDERWESVQNAVGALYKLVSSGEVEEGLEATAHPRTAVGVTADGNTVFYTVDGRQPGFSSGASMVDVAQRMVELGCVEAVLLDGGGSTNLSALYVGDENLTQVNSPSDGYARSVTNYIMLVTEKGKQSGEAERLGIEPRSALLLSGAKMSFNFGAADSAAFATALPKDANVSSDVGSIDMSGNFTAQSFAGTGRVTLASPQLGAVYANVQVITTPDSITISNGSAEISSLSLAPRASVDLSAHAMWGALDVIAQDNCFSWECDKNIGVIDENGVFTAAGYNCSGKITVSAGDKSVSIAVTVSGRPYLLEDFENGTGSFTGSIEVEKDHIKVSRGQASARLDYSLSGGRALLCTSSLRADYAYIHMNIYGDGSGNTLYIGESVAAVLDFTGWRSICVQIQPESALTLSISGSGSGNIWIDHIVCSPDKEADSLAPTLSLSAENGKISASISDNGVLSASSISLKIDSSPIDFAFDQKSGMLSASVPEDGAAHRISLEVSDIYGNRARASITLEPDEYSHPFADMLEHWAEKDVEYLFMLGYIGGYLDGDVRTYEPDTAMTRADFAALLARWLKLDVEDYSDYVLPFDDNDEIPETLLPYVRAVCAEGIIYGISDYGTLRFAPTEPLTRAQAMTMIGRIQSCGYSESELDFSDALEVESWALPYVRTLVAQQVVNGHNDGTLRPNESVTRAEAAKMIAFVI